MLEPNVELLLSSITKRIYALMEKDRERFYKDSDFHCVIAERMGAYDAVLKFIDELKDETDGKRSSSEVSGQT
jgi:hypothetical protein